MRHRWLAAILATASTLVACEDRAATPVTGPSATVPDPDSARRTGKVVAVDDQAFAAELDVAMREARRTAASARRRWMESQGGSDIWSVKWAAPVIGGDGAGRTEHVWITPLRWTANRIEGVLLNQPAREIGAARGDLVGFPADELSDWLHEHRTGRGDLERVDGGFTITVIERHDHR